MLDWLLDVTFLTAGTDILLLAIVVLPLGFAAIIRAGEAVKANPDKSNRAIAAELGVVRTTVQRAREEVEHHVPLDEERIGRNITDNPSSRRAFCSS